MRWIPFSHMQYGEWPTLFILLVAPDDRESQVHIKPDALCILLVYIYEDGAQIMDGVIYELPTDALASGPGIHKQHLDFALGNADEPQ